jgi:hypothetical protein
MFKSTQRSKAVGGRSVTDGDGTKGSRVHGSERSDLFEGLAEVFAFFEICFGLLEDTGEIGVAPEPLWSLMEPVIHPLPLPMIHSRAKRAYTAHDSDGRPVRQSWSRRGLKLLCPASAFRATRSTWRSS